jgi:hypothetical protein
MPRPGFYNDNEYRAYPFIYRAGAETNLPTSTILDAGFIMGLDAHYDAAVHTVWLAAAHKTNTRVEFVFHTNATNTIVTFTRHENDEWALEHSDSSPVDNNPCADEPVWSGFIATGPLEDLFARFAAAGRDSLYFSPNEYQIEPTRIQNLNKAYLRSISVGNYDRMRVSPCDVVNVNVDRPVILNTRCMKNDIKFKEGYNCLITQTDRANELTITAATGAGAGNTSEELCVGGGEIPFYVDEPRANDSQFYSGGPACNELISTINGVGGPTVTIIGGAGVNILIDGDTITVQKKPNAQVNCT